MRTNTSTYYILYLVKFVNSMHIYKLLLCDVVVAGFVGSKIYHGHSCGVSDVCADANGECNNGRCACRTGYGLGETNTCGMSIQCI